MGRRATTVLTSLGPKVLTKLKRRFGKVGEAGRRRMLRIAVQVRGSGGLDLLVQALESGHADQVLEAGTRLAEELADAKPRERAAALARIDKFLESAEAGRNEDAAGAAVDLVARILGADAQERLFRFAESSNPPFVRRRAMEALARIAPEADLPAERLQRLLAYLQDRDYSNVVAPAMAVLENAALSAAHVPPLLECLEGNDPALRRFAVSALGQVDTPRSAAALGEVLKGDNPDLKKRAADALTKQRSAVALAVAGLAEAPDTNTAWVLARILHPHLHRLKPDQVATLAAAAAAWLEPGDPRAVAVISVLQDRYLEPLAEAAIKRVRRMKKERKAGEIVNLLRPLLRDGAQATDQVRYEVALAEIVRGRNDVIREVRLTNPGLLALEPLLHVPEFALLTRLKREKHFLEPEEYYLIGCHFAERPFADRAFGGDILRWIVRTFPEDTSAQAAAHKLVMEGFPPPPQPRRRKAAPSAKKKAPAKKVAKKPANRLAKKPAKKMAKKTAKKAASKSAGKSKKKTSRSGR
ncbi:MAG: HEAT repeat domain-containing protein [Planctomycetota bacterium]